MHRLYVHGDGVRLENADESVRYLLADALLHREATRKHSHEPRQLRDPDDVLVGDISNMSVTMEGKGMMLT
jgi:hypothetical protein